MSFEDTKSKILATVPQPSLYLARTLHRSAAFDPFKLDGGHTPGLQFVEMAETFRRFPELRERVVEAFGDMGSSGSTREHPSYADGVSTETLIAEAMEFCQTELDAFEGPEYDDDAEVCCQRSNVYIRELVRRLSRATERND